MNSEEKQKNTNYPKVTFKDISRAFWNGIEPYKWWLFVIIASVIIINILGAILPLFYKQFFDVITSTAPKNIVAGKLISVIINIAIFNGIIWIFSRYSFINNAYQAKVITRLKQQAYDHVMQHSYGFFTNNFTGSLVQKVNRFGRAFERMSDRILWDMLSLAVNATSIIVIVFFINRWIALVILAWAIIFLVFNVVFSIWKIKYDLKLAEIDSKTTAYLADTITNQNTVQLFNRFGFESAGYKKATDEQADITQANWNLTSWIEAGQAFLSFAIEFLLFYFTIKYWQQGLVTVGFFVLLQAYLINLMNQLWGFTRMIRDVYQSYADAKEMVEIMQLPHAIQDVPNARALTVKKGTIEFDHLDFNFHETRNVLKNINLNIKPGEKVALIGPSGAGKSTFVKLLLRLYSPTSGKILIDGQDIALVSQNSLRENIAMVPQEPVLFHRTLAENISYGKMGALKADIEKAAQLAHCDEFIKDLPLGFETLVGERGIKLSGGERQRVAIARAILKNAPILVLDEATSSLDSRSEMLIQDALNVLMAGKTTIVIAHRLSTIQKMDRIIVIDKGEIIEQGTHSALLANEKSLYKKLWDLQAGGFLKEEDDGEEISEDEGVEDDGE